MEGERRQTQADGRMVEDAKRAGRLGVSWLHQTLAPSALRQTGQILRSHLNQAAAGALDVGDHENDTETVKGKMRIRKS